MSPISPRDLPSVDRLLREPALVDLLERQPRGLVVEAAREALDGARAAALAGADDGLTSLPERVVERVAAAVRPPLRSVVNATGVIVHTNLGRAPLSPAALAAAQRAGEGYSNLEYDLERGERGSRHELVTGLLRRLTGGEDALVVNNNAAALLLSLTALAQGQEVAISRGQLVEIGGGFRIPDVMLQSGAQLVEVGTTNRTHGADYERAISERTALLLRVHSSNFLQVGFTSQPSLAELAGIAGRHGLPVVDDLGSGSLLDTARYGLAREPMVQDSISDGASLVCFSGDKLLGGPQAGILVGRRELIVRLKKHPLTRAVRPDKLSLAALGATLVHYLRGEAEREVPVWRMISTSVDALEERGRRLAAGLPAAVVESEAAVGGGSLPGQTLASRAVALRASSPDGLAARLRSSEPPVVGHIERDRVLLDLRTVLPEQDDLLRAAVQTALST